jgi:hypothetical protein
MYQCIALGLTQEIFNGPGYATNVHIIKHVEGIGITMCRVNCIKFSNPNEHNSGKTQWTRIYN